MKPCLFLIVLVLISFCACDRKTSNKFLRISDSEEEEIRKQSKITNYNKAKDFLVELNKITYPITSDEATEYIRKLNESEDFFRSVSSGGANHEPTLTAMRRHRKQLQDYLVVNPSQQEE
jgi:cysteine synthase